MAVPRLVLLSRLGTRTLARESVRGSGGRPIIVIDLDGSYVPVGAESVVAAEDLLSSRELHLLVAASGPDDDLALVSRLSGAAEAHLGHPMQPLRGGVLLDPPVGGSPLDLSSLDPQRPWVLDPADPHPATLLSTQPDLAASVAEIATRLRDDEAALANRLPAWDAGTSSLGIPVDALLRHLYRAAAEADGNVPDPYAPAEAAALRTWLVSPPAPGHPSRYLGALLACRPDLRAAFPAVPGPDAPAFLAWVRVHAAQEGYPTELVQAAAEASPVARRPVGGRRPDPGVNVVGFLTGELGIGESARQLVNALDAVHVPRATRPVDLHLASTRRAIENDGQETVFDTTVICVNADLTPAVAATVPELMRRSYRIGMWYWEVEDFPTTQYGGFAPLDEVWVATDFVRRAIEPHSPVPVRTLTPPLPQRGPDPALTRADLGLPEAPLFLFSFDYLSTAERKNPVGLVDAFARAFRPGDGPVLVIKSINADQRVADAERLRLRAAERPDVILLEDYLEPAARDALVAHCDCYVSLHRSEGLGLTMAEAMAWGKPVIATGYSGNLQFMHDENSFLVPWTPAPIPAHAEPYPAGGVWADPDLDAAAMMMRLVVDAPDVAAARGARAAHDIATLHTADVAGAKIAARLTELAVARRRRSHPSLVTAVRRAVRAAAVTLRDELR